MMLGLTGMTSNVLTSRCCLDPRRDVTARPGSARRLATVGGPGWWRTPMPEVRHPRAPPPVARRGWEGAEGGRHERTRVWKGRPREDVPKVGGFVRYVCAFRNEATDDDLRYAHLTLDWPSSGESQALGAHAACLRAAAHGWISLAA